MKGKSLTDEKTSNISTKVLLTMQTDKMHSQNEKIERGLFKNRREWKWIDMKKSVTCNYWDGKSQN